MRTLASALALSIALAGLSACNGDVDPSASGVFPASGFLGRKMRVQISGDQTEWDATAKVSFGPGVIVENVSLASPTALFAEIRIEDTAIPGVHDVSVTADGDTLTLKNAFEITSPISIQYTGTIAQGSIARFNIVNHDFASPFDSTSEGGLFTPVTFTNLELTPPTGVRMEIGDASAFGISGTMLIDVDAAPGPLLIESGPPDGQITTFASGGNIEVEARSPKPLVSGTRADGSFSEPFESHLYEIATTQMPGLAIFNMTTSDPEAAPGVAVLPSSGSFDELIGYASTIPVIADFPEKYYAIVVDLDGASGYPWSLTGQTMNLNVAQEVTTNNDTSGNGQMLATLPVQVANATLSAGTDVDWYRFTAVAGDIGKTVHVMTTPGDAQCDTVVEVFTPNATTSFAGPSDADYHEELATPAIAAAGTFWIKVTWSSETMWNTNRKSYNLLVRLQ